jgi:hypothetical protein
MNRVSRRQVNDMSPLSKELISKLVNENDIEVLKEVLNYYIFLKEKKVLETRQQWDSIEEDEPEEEELKIIEEFRHNPEKFEFVSMEEVLKELHINESEL